MIPAVKYREQRRPIRNRLGRSLHNCRHFVLFAMIGTTRSGICKHRDFGVSWHTGTCNNVVPVCIEAEENEENKVSWPTTKAILHEHSLVKEYIYHVRARGNLICTNALLPKIFSWSVVNVRIQLDALRG